MKRRTNSKRHREAQGLFTPFEVWQRTQAEKDRADFEQMKVDFQAHLDGLPPPNVTAPIPRTITT